MDWALISQIADQTGRDVLTILKPYLPALARSGQDVFDGFVKHLMDQDWAQIDGLMYARMTVEEREELAAAVYKDAYEATMQKFKNKELAKELLFKAALSLLVKII